MPADLNRVTLVGRLTKEPELRQTAGGTSICAMRLAVTSRQRDPEGNWSDTPNYFDVTLFGRQADTAAQYLDKGRRVGIDGRLSWREWTDKDGGRRQSVEVIGNDLYFLDSRKEGDAGPGGEMPVAAAATTAPAADDDLPF